MVLSQLQAALAGALTQAGLAPYIGWPLGLLTVLGLVPLLLFYLVRPHPEERVMPSMRFFLEAEDHGHVQQALRWLRGNIFLLLQALFVLLVAAAMAEPVLPGMGRADRAVIVVDQSASMADDWDDVPGFVARHMGRSNTVVVVGDGARVVAEDAGPGRVRSIIQGLQPRDVRTDIAAGLSEAGQYDGRLVVASDLDQTVDERAVRGLVQRFVAGPQPVFLMETGDANRWAVVDVEPGRRNATFTVRNVDDAAAEVVAETSDGPRRLVLEAGAVADVSLPVGDGAWLRLPDDPVPADNAGRVAVPPGTTLDVTYIGDEPHPYLRTATELINATRYDYVSPPVDDPSSLSADIYVVGRSERLLTATAEALTRRVRDGAGLVVFGERRLLDLFPVAPVRVTGPRRNVSVAVEEPRPMQVGEVSLLTVERTRGTATATHDAVVRAQAGDGRVMFYGLHRSGFRFDFLYPVFWKDAYAWLGERPLLGARTVRTGTELAAERVTLPSGETRAGPVRALDAGYYNTTAGRYAANLVDSDESVADGPAVRGDAGRAARVPLPVQPHVIGVALLVLVLELALLRWERVV